jgi:hypothetical protein
MAHYIEKNLFIIIIKVKIELITIEQFLFNNVVSSKTILQQYY